MNKESIISQVKELHKEEIAQYNDLDNKKLQLESSRNATLITIIAEYFPKSACDRNLVIDPNGIRIKDEDNISSTLLELFESWSARRSMQIGHFEYLQYKEQLQADPSFIIPIKDPRKFNTRISFGSNWTINYYDSKDFAIDKCELGSIATFLSEWMPIMNNKDLYAELMNKLQRTCLDALKEIIFLDIEQDKLSDVIMDSLKELYNINPANFKADDDLLEYLGAGEFSNGRYDRDIVCKPLFVKRTDTYTTILWVPIRTRPDYKPFSTNKRITNAEFDNYIERSVRNHIDTMFKDILYNK